MPWFGSKKKENEKNGEPGSSPYPVHASAPPSFSAMNYSQQPQATGEAGGGGWREPPPPYSPTASYQSQAAGYPQQGGYPQQSGYPQEGGYPQQGGYPAAVSINGSAPIGPGTQVHVPGMFNAGARFDGHAQPRIPPPPPGVAPNAAQLAAMSGATVVTSVKKSDKWVGGAGGGAVFW